MKKVLDQSQNKSLLLSFVIEWHEGFERGLEGVAMKTWKEVRDAFNIIYEDHGNEEGYSKVGVSILWNNGFQIVHRIDVGNYSGDYSAKKETIGEYLKRQICRMYESKLPMGELFTEVSFEDEPGENPEPQQQKRKIEIINIPVERSHYGVSAAGSIIKLQNFA